MFQPCDDTLVLTRVKRGKSEGGIELPDNANEPIRRGLVVAKGPGKFHPDTKMFVPLCPIRVVAEGGETRAFDGVHLGDVVIYRAHSSVEVTEAGEKYELVDASEVLAVVPDKSRTEPRTDPRAAKKAA